MSHYATATALSSPGSTLTDFSTFVDLSTLPTAWWDAVDTTDGTKGRVTKGDDTELACCWVDFDSGARTGYVWFKWSGDITNSDLPEIKVYAPEAAVASRAPGDLYGRYNAFDSGWGGFWTLSDLNDLTSNGRTLTANNAPTAGATGKFGDCYQFAAASSQSLTASISSQNVSNRTMIGWVSRTSDAGQTRNTVLSLGRTSGSQFTLLGYRQDISRVVAHYFNGFGGDSVNKSGSVNSPTWYHIAAVFNRTGNSIRSYHNGVVATGTFSQGDSTIDTISIGSSYQNGADAPLYFWDGYLAWIQLHDVARSDDWIAYDRTIGEDNATFWGFWTVVGSGSVSVGSIQVTDADYSAIGVSIAGSSGGVGPITHQLQRSLNDGSALSWSNVGSPQAGLTWSDTTVSPNTSYLYRVLATDGVENAYTSTVAGDADDGLEIKPPLYGGKPTISGLTTITPKITCSRITGELPAGIHFSACESTYDAGSYGDFDYRWDFGDSSGSEEMTNHLNGDIINPNTSQRGSEVAYLYRNAGTFTVTLTMSGRDENGVLIKASTTTLYTPARWGVFIGDATGGDFTLTYGGNTTAAIAYNATDSDKEAALHLLAGLDATNCRVFDGCVHFLGNLSGVSTALTGNFAGLTGGTGGGSAPSIREDVPAATGSLITITDSAWSEIFIDPDYGGENGASDGTITKPYTLWSDIATFLANGQNEKIVSIKRGTTLTASSALYWEAGARHRVRAYGSGAKPIITGRATFFIWAFSYGESSYDDKEIGDFVCSDIRFEQNGDGTIFNSYSSGNGNQYRTYARCGPIVLDNCESTTDATGDAPFASLSGGGNGSSGIQSVLLWNCNLDAASASKSTIFITLNYWVAVIGGSITGGDASYVFDHHFYNNSRYNTCVRYVNGGLATSKGFFVNANVKTAAGTVAEFHWYQGNNVYGAMNGFDFSNSNNSQGASDGYFRNVGVEGNRIHSGKLAGTSDQRHGIYGANIESLTSRDNLFWDCDDDSHVNAGGFGAAKPTVWNIYRNRVYGVGSIVDPTEPNGYLKFNRVYTTGANSVLSYYNDTIIDTWDIDNNQVWAPSATEPFFNSDTSSWVSLASWQTGGRDVNGNEADPNWNLPSSGDFSQAGFPALQDANINIAGNLLTINFTENVTGQTSFTLTSSSSAVTLSSPSGNGTSTHTYVLSRTINSSEIIRLNYDSSSGISVDDSGNPLPKIFDATVTNLVSGPVLQSAAINSTGTTLTLTFDKNVTGQAAFTLSSDGGVVTLSSPTGNGTAIHVYALSRIVYSTEALTVSYDSGVGTSVDDSANALASFSDIAVINSSIQTITTKVVRISQINSTRNSISTISVRYVGRLSGTITYDDGTTTVFYTVLDEDGVVSVNPPVPCQPLIDVIADQDWLETMLALISPGLILSPMGSSSPGKTVSDASLHFFGRATGGGIVSDFFVEYSDLIPGGYYVENEAGYDNIPSSVIVGWLESVAGVGGVATS